MYIFQMGQLEWGGNCHLLPQCSYKPTRISLRLQNSKKDPTADVNGSKNEISVDVSLGEWRRMTLTSAGSTDSFGTVCRLYRGRITISWTWSRTCFSFCGFTTFTYTQHANPLRSPIHSHFRECITAGSIYIYTKSLHPFSKLLRNIYSVIMKSAYFIHKVNNSWYLCILDADYIMDLNEAVYQFHYNA